nr:hypothetical protein CFP56_79726 [Quercus suber]
MKPTNLEQTPWHSSPESLAPHLQIPIFVEEEIFRLEIAVEHASGVAVTDDEDQLLETPAAEIFAEPAPRDLREELAVSLVDESRRS